MSGGDTTYYRTVCTALPTDHAERVKALCTSTSAEAVIDSLIRFVIGAECFPDAPADTRKEWDDKQIQARKALDELQKPSDSKRVREEDDSGSQSVKRQRRLINEAGVLDVPPQDDPPLSALHSISATSPVRKKVDITIHKSSIRFTHPSTHAIEAVALLSNLQRAFILPTRGRSRPYWTVVLLSSHTQNGGTAASSNLQIMFGIDAQLLAPTSTTTYTSSSSPSTKSFAKGSATLPLLHNLLSHLPTHALPVLEPSIAVFRSACSNTGGGSENGGIPGVVAYRAAKAGNLWFFKEGILWGDSKPCEFWSVEDLINKSDGVKLVSATGRTCSVILTRKTDTSQNSGHASSGGGDDGDGDEGVETEFGMVDGREQPGINQWVRQHRHLFGKKKVVEKASGSGIAKPAANATDADSDDSDEDFEVNSDDEDGGSPSTASSDESADASGGSEGDAEESGSDADDEGELKVENHPLLRPGAMPRMSRAAIDAVVGMVEDDLAGGHEGEPSNAEEDELDDYTPILAKPSPKICQ